MSRTIEDQLTQMETELKTHHAKAAEEQKQQGAVALATKEAVDTLTVKYTQLQKQTDAIDQRTSQQYAGGGGAIVPSLEQQLKENESFQRFVRDKRGTAVISLEGKNLPRAFQSKTTITSPIVGYQTTGVMPIERIPGIVPEPRVNLTVRDLLPARPTSFQVIDYVRVTTPMAMASPVAEAALKPENAVGFTSFSERVKTLATWIPATKQVLDDWPELAGYIETALPYAVNLCEEIELLLGDGTGEHLHGIIPQATAFNSGLLVPASGYSRIDVIGRAIQQLNSTSELAPTFVILNPKDAWSLRLTKDTQGRYMLGDPQSMNEFSIFGLQVAVTPNMPVGQFVVGSGSPVASEIRDRMGMQVELSTEHADYFVRNMVAIRAEKRLAYIMKRPGSFITGTLASSPIS